MDGEQANSLGLGVGNDMKKKKKKEVIFGFDVEKTRVWYKSRTCSWLQLWPLLVVEAMQRLRLAVSF